MLGLYINSPFCPTDLERLQNTLQFNKTVQLVKGKNLPAPNPLTNWFEQTQVSRPPHHSFVCIFWLEWLTDLFLLFTFSVFFVFPFFMTTLLQLDVFSPNDKPIKKITALSCKTLLSFSSLWNSIQCFQLNVKSNPGLLWFSCTCYVIGSENSRHFPNQSKQNPKPSRFGHPRFPRLTVWSFLFRVLIGSSWHYPWHDWLLNLCWFCFTTLNRKPFNYDVFINFFLLFLSR